MKQEKFPEPLRQIKEESRLSCPPCRGKAKSRLSELPDKREDENRELRRILNRNARKRLLQRGNRTRFLRAMAAYLGGSASFGTADGSQPLPGHPPSFRVSDPAVPAKRLRRVLAALLGGDWLWLELLAACCLEKLLVREPKQAQRKILSSSPASCYNRQ